MTPVELDGWDNRTFRLGAAMTVRLPTAAGYVAQVAKENAWLPLLAPQPAAADPGGAGDRRAGRGLPASVVGPGWLPGTTLDLRELADPERFADRSGRLPPRASGADTAGGPLAGAHSFYRGTSPATTTPRPAPAWPISTAASTPAAPPRSGTPP